MRETEGSLSKKPTSELSGVGFICSYKQTKYLIPTARQIRRPTPTRTLTASMNQFTSPSSTSMYSDNVNILL
ncbi:hypothetical protein MA16_Dca006060 [Dendrobium catenatum]|uniref:Uncharacterized protein n=1 Tax=Dendrobium catenatum TaxID=906689 RepID=A0A2I0WK28_9ASPA|nr:hypothetical protein MA16_Dca006060 [Dendrobium catenatum]